MGLIRKRFIMVNIIIDLLLTGLYVGLAATMGHRIDPDTPTTPPMCAIEYFPWAFPLNRGYSLDVSPNRIYAVARVVLLEGYTRIPDPADANTNLMVNLRYNLPAYFLISTMLLLAANCAIYGGKKLRASRNRKRKERFSSMPMLLEV
jgi:hypothetical protein